MKKIILFVMTLVFIISLAACQPNEDKDVLKVGMDLKWPPFEMIDQEGNPEGISVALAEELGAFLGKEVKIVDTDFGSLIPALESNKIDIIIASMSITEERAKKISFSQPYFHFPLITLVSKESGITTKEQLMTQEGVRFVGPKSFVSLSIPLEQANNPKILQFDDAASSVLELISGRADAFIISASSAVEFHEKNKNTTSLIWEPVMLSPIGMGMRKDDIELQSKVDEFIAGLEKNGVYDRLRREFNDIIAKGMSGQTLDFYIYE